MKLRSVPDGACARVRQAFLFSVRVGAGAVQVRSLTGQHFPVSYALRESQDATMTTDGRTMPAKESQIRGPTRNSSCKRWMERLGVEAHLQSP